ncbi:hypothetical protein AGDE_16580 [Angomonas deanei]|nr:hypothetical protein AGDE_16580 [Angomonas deanei]|eukprot:EPY16838.1 hypothetical protein AGDE_16580 [Angomonas deanei]
MYTRQVVTNAERVGTRSRHFDLAVYFSEVAFFSQFWGENIDKMTRPVIPKSSESMREELPEFDFRLHTYRPTLIYEPVVRVDEQPSFGEIVPELVAIESILLTHNPLLGGVMPSEYLSFHFLVLLEAQFTSIMSQAPQVFPFRGNITSKREEREVYEAYYHVFHRQKQMEKPHRFMYGLLGSIDDLGSFLENEYRPTWRKKNNKNHTQTVEKHRGKTYHEVEDTLWSIRGTGLRGYASPILLLASSVRDGSKSHPLLKDAHKPESPSPVSFLQIMFRHGVFRTLGVCWRIGLQEGLRVLEELYQIENLAHD